MKTKSKGQIITFMVLIGIFSGMMFYTDVYQEIKSSIVDITCTSCIKMDPVTRLKFVFKTVNNQNHPRFIQENLTKGPIFLAFRADVCRACDKMDLIIKDIFQVDYGEKQLFYKYVNLLGSNISFYHINLDHTDSEFYNSFFSYDIDERKAVPMFVLITLGNQSGEIKPYFTTAYSTISGTKNDQQRKEYFLTIINEAFNLYSQYQKHYSITDH